MNLLFDFECSAGHRNEHLVAADVLSMQCVTCGRIAQRLIAAPRCALDPISGHFPGATAKWEANRESHMKQERKNTERHGTYK